MRTRCSLASLALAATLTARSAPAQDRARSGAPSVRMALENDLIAIRGRGAPPDHDYTHGARIDARWTGRCADARAREDGCTLRSLVVAQSIYTPRRDSAAPVPGERPYAGWLSLGAAAHRVRRGHVRTIGVEVGVTGPPSLAQPVQDGVHRLLDNRPQLGWEHQLATRFGVVARWEESHALAHYSGGSADVALRGAAGLAVGTVLATASTGVVLRVGGGRALSWSPSAPELPRLRRLQATVAWRRELVLRDAFVEGWRAGDAASRLPWVGQREVGVEWRWRRGGLAYAHVLRGREYHAQPAAHAWGRLVVELR